MAQRRIKEIRDIFAFYLTGEQEAINYLTAAVREFLVRAKKSQKTGLKKLLFALERLPYRTPGICISLSSSSSIGGELSFISFDLTEEGITFSRGGTVATEKFGHDGYCNTWATIELGRRTSLGGEFESVKDDIDEIAAEIECVTSKIEIADDSAKKFSFDAEPVPKDGWTRLLDYYRNNYADEDDLV